MRIRFWIIPCLFLCLLAPSATAKQRKSHAGGKHPKANHPMSKVNKSHKPRTIKNKR
jgi:hypothetical protein